MNIGHVAVVGTGRIGLGVATLLGEAYPDVTVVSRTPDQPRLAGRPFRVIGLSDAASGGAGGVGRAAGSAFDAVVLAVPHGAIEEMAGPLTRLAGDGVLIDAANAPDPSAGTRMRSALGVPHGRWLATVLPGVRVTRAFTHVQHELLVARAHSQPDTWGMAVAGDDAAALAVTAEVVRAARYVPVPIGDLDGSGPLEPGGVLFPHMYLPGDLADVAAGARSRPA